MTQPTPQQIREARQQAGLSQEAAADLVCVSRRAWQFWEAGQRSMSETTWELFCLKTQQNKPD
ncbi:MAG: helix-turn-helix domain-containing protein [Zoogloeaceae bacterium]|jgi:DNA-binding transcriptional regulator YiaG|nr:helix-turn-helix domain-containing protein [Zoogloeaceae bacterium]